MFLTEFSFTVTTQNGDGTQRGWHKTGMAYNGEGTQRGWHTTGMAHNGDGTQLGWHTTGMAHNRSPNEVKKPDSPKTVERLWAVQEAGIAQSV